MLAAGTVPVPVKLTVSALAALPPPELLVPVIVSAPLRAPAAVGLKDTLTVQFAEAARLIPQLFVSMKSPVAARLEIVRPTVPVLVSVTVWVALLVFTI